MNVVKKPLLKCKTIKIPRGLHRGNPLGNGTNTKSWKITQELYDKAIQLV